jgi:hypothetical protein
MEDSVFIEVLKYGAEKGVEGGTLENMKKWICDHRDAELIETEHVLLENIFEECFEMSNGGTGGEKYNLKTEYYFKLIEYQELRESNKAAKSASRNAFTAIGISVFAMVFIAVFAFTQWNRPITINESDLNALISSNRHSNAQREVKLDSLQMAQILAAMQYSRSNPEPKKQKTIEQGQEVSHHELINQYFEDE